MERLILKRLLEWKNSPYRKPLILKGVRQVGKTWVLKEFGRRYYENTAYFRAEMEKVGFDLLPGYHPIVAVMLYDAKVAAEFADRMLKKGVYVTSFTYPVVPKGKARIRTQVSAGHTKDDLDFAVSCFKAVKEEMGL